MNRDALVVGINQYPFLKDTPTSKAKHLNTPASDAEAIALRLEEYGGFRVRRLPESIQEEQRQVDPKKLVQGEALHEAIIRLFNPDGDSIPQTALLYFAGHGLRRNLGGVTEGFLATSDSDPRKNQWGVSLRWLRELLQRSPVQQQIVWLDCCYSGELLNFAEADLGTVAQGRTRFFIAAAREFEPAEENIQGQHGVFSQVLWEGLDPRRQPEGVVNNDRLIEYIDQTLKGTPQQPIWYNPNCEIILTGAREEVFVSTLGGVCPYKGLRFFDVEDAPYFYGREALTQKLIERVQVGKENFLAVLGVSGSGKSSVLRAGLMYQLQQERRLPGTEQWKIRIFTPGEQPLVSLATAFLDEEVTDIERAEQLKAAEDAIAQGATGLARLIRASKSLRTVLIVDQFEEVFTVCQSQIDRQQFISSLWDTLKQTGDKLCLIFAMRDDFLGKCAAYQELAELIQANLVMVTPMNAQELRQAIVEPAKKLGRKVEENLIDVILKDLGVEVEQQTREPEPGMLPLLSYTLEQLWQRQTLNWLKLDSYNQLGGVQKTLENLAEQVYRQLSVEEQRVADQIFIKLTQLGEGTPDTRKQVPQQDLVAQAQSAELVEQVIQKLAQAKLIVTSEQRKGQEKVAVVDVAHEALIRYWWRLRELLDNNREAIRTERKIQAAAEEWRDKGKSKDYLLRGKQLREAKSVRLKHAGSLTYSQLLEEFIQASVKQQWNSRLIAASFLTIPIFLIFAIFEPFLQTEAAKRTIASANVSGKKQAFEYLTKGCRVEVRQKIPGYLANLLLGQCIALNQADLRGVDFRKADLHNLDLRDVDLRGADLTRANLSSVDLGAAQLQKAILVQADLSKARISKPDPTSAGFRHKGADLSGADLRGVNLSEADLPGASLRGANLMWLDTGADTIPTMLHKANLVGADLSNANLSDASLREANLFGVNFKGATLERTGFDNSILTEANFSNTNLTKTDLSQAILCRTTMPDGIRENRDCSDPRSSSLTIGKRGWNRPPQ